jgi:creatinine amidohydrolase
MGRPEGLVSDEAAAIDIHGGDIETSVMLALHPDLVNMKKARNFKSAQSKWLKTNTYLHAYGRHAFGWKMQDLNPLGVTGNASNASAARGEALLAHSTAGLVQLLKEVDRFKMSDLENEPQTGR